MNRYDMISPIDFRYYTGELYEKLQPFLSERALITYQVKVEVALAETLAAHGVCSKEVAREIREAADKISAEDVYEEDTRIKHSTRAIVNCMRKHVSDAAKPYVHFTTTSFDIVDTANAARYKAFVQEILVPESRELQKVLIDLALREKDTVQIGRTHGQHAVPITFGYAIAEYVDRIGNVIRSIQDANERLVGKVSGAVGSHNSQKLFIENPLEFERDVLARLGLQPAMHSTQVVQPEFLLGLLHHAIALHGVVANLADDMRHLQRSEISEIAEQFGSNQVGSSTMPHKRNPSNFENVKSMWKETMPRIITHYMDQICEHQRDLTNSASGRFIQEIFALTVASISRIREVMSRVIVDKQHMQRNFDTSKHTVIAEALYLLLAAHGHPDAHECVRRVTLESQKSGKTVLALAQGDEEINAYLAKFAPEQMQVLEHPERYIGLCTEKTESICAHWRKA